MIKIAFFDVDGTLLQLGSKEPSPRKLCRLYRSYGQNGGLVMHGNWQRLSLRPAF